MALNFDGKKYFQVIILSFLVIQISSWILHTLLDFPLLKLGWMMILFLAVILIITLYTLGTSINQLDLKTIAFILIVFGSVVTMIILLPRYIPEIFTISSDYSEILKSQINSVLGIGG